MRGPEQQPPPAAGAPIGFGGAVVRSQEELPERSEGDACFFGVDDELGRVFGGSNAGAAVFMRQASARMHPWTRRERPGATDIGVMRGPPAQLLEDVLVLGAGLSARGFVPVAIGCDHTLSYALALGVCRERRVTYVYFDAHLDLGLHDERELPALHNGNFVRALVRSGRFEQVVNVGARSWTTYDDVYGARSGVTVLRSADVGALEFLKGREVHVSLDMDVLDPTFVPNVCCREPFGLTPRELLDMMTWLGRNCRVVGADVSELAADPRLTHTAEIALRCVHEIVGRRAEEPRG